MDVLTWARTDSLYPPALKTYLRDDAPARIAALGNLDILQRRTLALFSSIRCPGNLILQTYDLAQNLRQQGVSVIGGFHSPMERETLTILLRGAQGVILCPARNIGAKMAREYAQPLEQGRLLILSPFDDTQTRITTETSVARNRFVAAIANAVFVPHAEPQGKLEQLCREVIAWGKPLFTFAENVQLVALGAQMANETTQFFKT
jgi:predicted Rossmann fold nucleotide-binding protein DprA/Smf involved in DNA uptake